MPIRWSHVGCNIGPKNCQGAGLEANYMLLQFLQLSFRPARWWHFFSACIYGIKILGIIICHWNSFWVSGNNINNFSPSRRYKINIFLTFSLHYAKHFHFGAKVSQSSPVLLFREINSFPRSYTFPFFASRCDFIALRRFFKPRCMLSVLKNNVSFQMYIVKHLIDIGTSTPSTFWKFVKQVRAKAQIEKFRIDRPSCAR